MSQILAIYKYYFSIRWSKRVVLFMLTLEVFLGSDLLGVYLFICALLPFTMAANRMRLARIYLIPHAKEKEGVFLVTNLLLCTCLVLVKTIGLGLFNGEPLFLLVQVALPYALLFLTLSATFGALTIVGGIVSIVVMWLLLISIFSFANEIWIHAQAQMAVKLALSQFFFQPLLTPISTLLLFCFSAVISLTVIILHCRWTRPDHKVATKLASFQLSLQSLKQIAFRVTVGEYSNPLNTLLDKVFPKWCVRKRELSASLIHGRENASNLSKLYLIFVTVFFVVQMLVVGIEGPIFGALTLFCCFALTLFLFYFLAEEMRKSLANCGLTQLYSKFNKEQHSKQLTSYYCKRFVSFYAGFPIFCLIVSIPHSGLDYLPLCLGIFAFCIVTTPLFVGVLILLTKHSININALYTSLFAVCVFVSVTLTPVALGVLVNQYKNSGIVVFAALILLIGFAMVYLNKNMWLSTTMRKRVGV